MTLSNLFGDLALDASVQQVLAELVTINAAVADLDVNTDGIEALLTAIQAAVAANDNSALEALVMSGNALLFTIDENIADIEALATTANALATTLNAQTDTVEALIAATNAALATLDSRVDGLEALVTATNAALATIDTRVDGVEALLTTISATLTTIDTRVDGVEALLTTIDGRVDGLEALITATNAKLDTVIAQQAFRPAQFPGRTHVEASVSGAAADATIYTVSPGKTLYITSCVFISRSNTNNFSSFNITDGAAGPIAVTIFNDAVKDVPNVVTQTFPEPVQFATSVYYDETAGDPITNISFTGYEE